MHYFTKIGAGEYYLEELEETVCEVEIRYRITTTHSCLLGYSSRPRAHEQLNSVAESPVPVLNDPNSVAEQRRIPSPCHAEKRLLDLWAPASSVHT